MKKYPSIEQYRSIVKAVRNNHDYQGLDPRDGTPLYSHESPYPILPFIGTVKLHGTNAGIVRYRDGRTEFQSRSRVLNLGSDNMGFYAAHAGLNLDKLFAGIDFNESIAIYGEWVGKGIQQGVALSQLDRKFIIFDVVVDGQYLLPQNQLKIHDVDNNIYNIFQFTTFSVRIDFENPEAIQNELIRLTSIVEEECPVGKFFGVSGVGEGIVWRSLENPALKFKVKGEKHSSSKVKTLAAVDTEKLASIQSFVDYACTENRLTQGLENVELDIKQTGEFLRWVANDIIKEEEDTLLANGLEWKSVAGGVAKKAAEFFKSKVNV